MTGSWTPAAAQLGALLCALLWLAACNSPRDPVTNVCTANQHCPAGGKWYCDLDKKQCVACEGPCPVSRIPDKDVGEDKDADTTTDDATDTAADGGADATDTAVTSDAGVVAADASNVCTQNLPTIAGTCVDKCFQFESVVYTDGTGKECSCDPWCKLNIAGVPACCDDYELACGCLDTSNVSCSGRCGVRDPNKTCQCDALCDSDENDDCCEDYGSVCGKCPDGKCVYSGDSICQCDTLCLENQDCCVDFNALSCPKP